MSKVLTPKPPRSQLIAINVADLLHELGGIPPKRVRMVPTPGYATKKDLLRVLEVENIPCELVQGTIVEKAMGQLESELTGLLIYYLHVFLASHDLGRIYLPDAPFELRKNLIRMPDIAFVSHAKIPSGSRKQAVATWVPDLAVEILSKGNTQREIDRKLQEYLDAGVQIVWVVDPRKRIVTVHMPDHQPIVLNESKTLDGGKVLPGFKLKIKDWFAKVD
jgi:Uma2 family endonuclease